MADVFGRLLRPKREFQVGVAAAGDTQPAAVVSSDQDRGSSEANVSRTTFQLPPGSRFQTVT